MLCKTGQQLTAEQAALLRLLGIQMTEFRINCLCWWGEEEGLTELAENVKSQPEATEDDEDEEGMSS